MGADAASAVPFHIARLGQEDHDFGSPSPPSRPVAGCLVAIGAPALPSLIGSLSARDLDLRRNAAETLRDMGRAAAPAVPALARALRDPDDEVRREAVLALGSIGPAARAAVPAMTEFLRDKQNDSGDSRLDCVRSLAGMGKEADSALPALIDLLGEEYWGLADAAAKALPSIDGDGKVVIPLLLERMKSPSPDVKERAILALKRYGCRAEAVVPAILGALDIEDLREDAMWALGELGNVARPAAPRLVEILRTSREPQVRYAAAAALADIGETSDDALRAILEELRRASRSDRRDPLSHLAKFGPRSETAVRALVDALEDRNVCGEAAEALAGLGADLRGFLDRIRRSLRSEQREVREATARLLETAGPWAEGLVPDLIEILKDEKAWEAQRSAIISLGNIGPGARSALPSLIELNFHFPERPPSPGGFYGGSGDLATTAIKKIGLGDGMARSLLEGGEGKDSHYFEHLATILGEVAQPASEIIPVLVKLLDHPDDSVLVAAATSLGLFGPKAVAAVPRLKVLTKITKKPVAGFPVSHISHGSLASSPDTPPASAPARGCFPRNWRS